MNSNIVISNSFHDKHTSTNENMTCPTSSSLILPMDLELANMRSASSFSVERLVLSSRNSMSAINKDKRGPSPTREWNIRKSNRIAEKFKGKSSSQPESNRTRTKSNNI